MGAAKGHLDRLARRRRGMERGPRNAAPRCGGDGARARPDQPGPAAGERRRGRSLRPRELGQVGRDRCPRATATSGSATRAQSSRGPATAPSLSDSRPMAGAASSTSPTTHRRRRHRRARGRAESRKFDFVLEGGAIDHDGPGHDPDHAADAAERQSQRLDERGGGSGARRRLRRAARSSGSTKVSLNDHTDGHVDNVARFVGAGPRRLPVAVRRRRSQCRASRERRADARDARPTRKAASSMSFASRVPVWSLNDAWANSRPPRT